MALDYSGVWQRPRAGERGSPARAGTAVKVMDYPRRLAPNG
jgi:hypothetical protein